MNEKFLRRVKRNDRIAKWVISLGGIAIIGAVILILVLIANVAVPLFLAPKADVFAKFPLAESGREGDTLAVGVDEYLETGYFLDASGRFHFFNTQDGKVTDTEAIEPPVAGARLVAANQYGRLDYGLLWSSGQLTLAKVKFRPFFDAENNNKRTIRHTLEQVATLPPVAGSNIKLARARISDEGRTTRVDLHNNNQLHLAQTVMTESLFGDTEEETYAAELTADLPGVVSTVVIDGIGNFLYAGTENGYLLRWDLREPGEIELLDKQKAFADNRAITAINLVFGDYSLAVGDEQGQVTTWFPVREEKNKAAKRLTRIHDLSRHDGEVAAIMPSTRDKSVLSLGADGILHLDHMTSERELLTLGNHAPLTRFSFSTRGDSVIALTEEDRLVVWKFDNPHPEISFKTLFGKVWYEGYDEPAYAWQSSSASDDFEPKLSLTPLIFGTLKGTFYAMLFAVPLALFGAVYVSQFCRPRLREMIKPAVEIMAAVPTVIIGFLAALWLAPLIERSLGAIFLSIIFIPAGLMLAIASWQALRKVEPLKGLERGYEFLAVTPLVILTVAAAFSLGPLAENLLFGGDLKQWLFTEMGTRYDPRNCIVIAFAMGFAVIPIIFTIAEDSLSNVPASLKAASLACGASRWQTVWRVILPSASPGIFAGTMIGFGRAVGETMIVLMATGNTAIMDLSIFNGMRPLSSNIAVEVPEAPHGGTLYRTLFLSAVILFVMTFIVNTVAEIVRQRLRQKYGRF